MADPDDIARIQAYIEQYSKTYNRESLRRNLIRDGHDPQAVDAALERVYGSGAGAPTTQASRAGLYFILAILGGIAIHSVVVFATILAVSGVTPSNWFLAVIALPIVGEIAVAVMLWRRNTRVARGLAWGLASSLVVTLLLFGACIALITSLNFQ